jgi:hypothetical protein
MRQCGLLVLAGVLAATACNPAADDADSEGTESDVTGADGSSSGVGGDGGEVLGCPAGQQCDLVLVSQSLDDRVEVFSAADPGGQVYRGAIDLDLKPNVCDGCELGDYADGRLDEPYGLAVAGQHLHVLTGHYPAPDLGTLVSFPFSFFVDRPAGATIAVSDFFDGAMFSGVTETPLGQLEPIFATAVSGKLLVTAFNNDLFTTEDTWTQPGRLLVLDSVDPQGAGIGVVDLGGLQGGACNGAAQSVVIGEGRVAVACDGNEGVGILDVGTLAGTPAEAAAAIQGSWCPIPGASNRRVRHVAPDGLGGFVVVDGPGAELLSDARLWWFDSECAMQGLATLDGSDWQLSQIVAMPQFEATWIFGSGAASPAGNRGIYVAQGSAGQIQICGPLVGFDELWTDANGELLEPLGLAIDEEGAHVAIGAGPFAAPPTGPGFGRVAWATLQGAADPCSMTASVVDLSAEAPAVDAMAPATYRRAPAVVEVVRVHG